MEPQYRAVMLRDAVERYRISASPFYDEVVADVVARADQSGSIGKADIGALVTWKRLNASTRWASRLMQTPERNVRAATATAREAALEGTVKVEVAASHARTALSHIPGFGVGDALASAVIYALAPARMAVYDRRAQLGISHVGLALSPSAGRYGRYMALVDQLITETKETGDGLTPREIDLALFTLGAPTS